MLRAEAVTEREVGVNELPPGCRVGELLAQPADVDVHRPIARSERPAPCLLGEDLAAHHRTGMPRERDQEPKFVAGQVQGGPVQHGNLLTGAHFERARLEDFRQRSFHDLQGSRLSLSRGLLSRQPVVKIR